jgi:hypothetical protein
MLVIKKYLIGLLLGAALGFSAGINVGHDRPFWANPFADVSLTEKAQNVATDAWQDAKKAASERLAD